MFCNILTSVNKSNKLNKEFYVSLWNYTILTMLEIGISSVFVTLWGTKTPVVMLFYRFKYEQLIAQLVVKFSLLY